MANHRAEEPGRSAPESLLRRGRYKAPASNTCSKDALNTASFVTGRPHAAAVRSNDRHGALLRTASAPLSPCSGPRHRRIQSSSSLPFLLSCPPRFGNVTKRRQNRATCFCCWKWRCENVVTQATDAKKHGESDPALPALIPTSC
ncbi:hypothetical protein MTO96_012063 [Rhipicephalus appendiculatus]